jgi:hypothetical protein
LSEGELDEAELSTHLALYELKAEDTERIHLQRTPSGILVEGIVADDRRKSEIGVRLRSLPHVTARISTFAEAERGSNLNDLPSTVQVAEQSAEPSPLDRYLSAEKTNSSESGKITDQIFKGLTNLLQVRNALAYLDLRDSSANQTASTREISARLYQMRYLQLKSALQQEQRALSELGFSSDTSSSSRDQKPNLRQALDGNIVLTRELIFPGSLNTRSPREIMSDLAKSLGTADSLVNEAITAASQTNAVFSSHTNDR